jgi:hypothetical protein
MRGYPPPYIIGIPVCGIGGKTVAGDICEGI